MPTENPLEKIHEIPLEQINLSDENVRSDAQQDLDELAASIKKHGLLQPVLLHGEFGKAPYTLIAGQRRFLANSASGPRPFVRYSRAILTEPK